MGCIAGASSGLAVDFIIKGQLGMQTIGALRLS